MHKVAGSAFSLVFLLQAFSRAAPAWAAASSTLEGQRGPVMIVIMITLDLIVILILIISIILVF